MRRRVVILLVLVLPVAVLATVFRANGAAGRVTAVGPIAMTVASAERSAAFYGDVLGFEKVSDGEVAGEAWDRLYGIASLRLRVVRMRLGDERIELLEFI